MITPEEAKRERMQGVLEFTVLDAEPTKFTEEEEMEHEKVLWEFIRRAERQREELKRKRESQDDSQD